MVVAELQLAGGEDHPARHLAAERPLLERAGSAGEQCPGQGDRDRRPRAEVPRAADDLPWLALAHVDAAELEPIGVRVLAGLDDLADLEEPEIAVGVRDA